MIRIARLGAGQRKQARYLCEPLGMGVHPRGVDFDLQSTVRRTNLSLCGYVPFQPETTEASVLSGAPGILVLPASTRPTRRRAKKVEDRVETREP